MTLASRLKMAVAVSALTVLLGYLVGNYALAQAGGAAPSSASSGMRVTNGGGPAANPETGAAGSGRGSGRLRADGSSVNEVFDGTNDFIFSNKDGQTTLVVKDAAGNILFNGPYTTDADKAKVPAGLAAEIAGLASLPAGGGGRGGGGARGGAIPPGSPMARGSGAVSGGGVRSGTGADTVSSSFRSDGKSTVRHYADASHDITFTETGANTTLVVKDSTGKVLFDGPYTTDAEKAKVPANLVDKVAGLAASLPGGKVGRGSAGARVTSSTNDAGGANNVP
jgi:hypothetical protein